MRITSMLAMSALVVAAGCSTPYSNTAYNPAYTSPTLTQSELDRALEASVRSQIDRYGDLRDAASNVQISAQNGTVTLFGTVPNEQERQMMEVVARNTSGVASVNDQLQVTYPPTGTRQGDNRFFAVFPIMNGCSKLEQRQTIGPSSPSGHPSTISVTYRNADLQSAVPQNCILRARGMSAPGLRSSPCRLQICATLPSLRPRVLRVNFPAEGLPVIQTSGPNAPDHKPGAPLKSSCRNQARHWATPAI